MQFPRSALSSSPVSIYNHICGSITGSWPLPIYTTRIQIYQNSNPKPGRSSGGHSHSRPWIWLHRQAHVPQHHRVPCHSSSVLPNPSILRRRSNQEGYPSAGRCLSFGQATKIPSFPVGIFHAMPMGGAWWRNQGAQRPRSLVQSGSVASCRGYYDKEKQVHVRLDHRVMSNDSCPRPTTHLTYFTIKLG